MNPLLGTVNHLAGGKRQHPHIEWGCEKNWYGTTQGGYDCATQTRGRELQLQAKQCAYAQQLLERKRDTMGYSAQ